jgi:hypothetical protein
MIIYIFMILYIGIFGLLFDIDKNYKIKQIYLFIFFGVIAIISSLRAYTIGVDTAQFYNAYKLISYTDWDYLDLFRYEYGFTVLCKILSYISKDPQMLLIFTMYSH